MANKHWFSRFLMLNTILINLFVFTISLDAEYPVVRVLKSVDPDNPESAENSSYDETGNFKVLNVSQNSDLLIENKVNSVAPTKLIFECRAPFLVQWLYTGLGSPEFSTNLTMISGHKEFVATMYLGFQRNLEEQDTGNYTCRSIRDSNISTYIYLFSPGAALFTTKGNENITYKETDEFVKIPCGLSQPNSSVTLQKSINGQLQCPMNDSFSFDPKMGYILSLKEFSDPQGFYICSAGYNHKFQMIEYNLVLDDSTGSNEDHSPEATSTTTTKTTTTSTSDQSQSQKCQINAECSSDTACIEESCVDPCTILCAKNSNCYIANHVPHCSCRNGYTGDPYSLECSKIETTEGSTTEKLHDVTTIKPEAKSPCEPNPCGQKSTCRYDGLRILCTCQSGYLGSPPHCRPECEKDSDCPYSRACTVEKKCENPCRAGVCGKGAQCRTVNHYPVCNCPRGTSGDAYVDCRPSDEINVEKPNQIVRSPCDSSVSPCGVNTNCIVVNNQAACRCTQGFRGSPYNGCRADGCSYNTHCSTNLACFVENGTCVDPCVLKNPCDGRKCVVNKHTPVCLPYPKPSSGNKENSAEKESCLSSPCGPNTICKDYKGAASCSCMPLFDGNPWIGCTKIKCRNDDSCKVGEKCVEGTCIQNRLKNDIVPEEYDDQTEHPEVEEEINVNICNASSCGNRTVCRVFDQMAICECIEPYKGNPYEGCELPCNSNSDCPKELSCSTKDNYCIEPCQSKTPCGQNAVCNVINHKVTCSCSDGHEGNPVVECYPVTSPVPPVQNENITNHNESISDPCTGVVCDINQKCVLKEGVVICECNESFKMKLGKGCVPEQSEEVKQNVSSVTTPATFEIPNYVHCHPLPCGSFAFCNEETDPKSCKCLPDFYGDPYSGCQKGIECESNDNCSSEAACMNKKCIDPCKTIMGCGVNQVCKTENHDPTCRCKTNYQTDAIGHCQRIVTV